MLHGYMGRGSFSALVGVMVLFASMEFMLHCDRASPGSGTTLLRSIAPDDF